VARDYDRYVPPSAAVSPKSVGVSHHYHTVLQQTKNTNPDLIQMLGLCLVTLIIGH